MTVKRLLGIILMLCGGALFAGSLCPYLLAIADYFAIAELWGATCPDSFRTKALLIGGVVIAVLGQRLTSGRNLRTGEKLEEPEV